MAAPPEPFEGSNFQVEIDGLVSSSFSRVELPQAVVDEVAHRSGTDRTPASRKAPGLSHYSHLVLSPGLTNDLELWHWWTSARDGDPSVDRDVAVRLLDATGSPALTWRFRNAFPVVHRLTPLDASSSDVVLETVELAFDAMDADA
ncbi:phage tail protein [Pedococcus soli]